MADLADYLDLTVSQAREQFRALLARRPAQATRTPMPSRQQQVALSSQPTMPGEPGMAMCTRF